MTTGPFNVAEVVERIEGGAIAGLRTIGSSADIDAARGGASIPMPAVFVVLARETGQPRQGGAIQGVQAVDARFSIVYALRDFRAADRGTAQSESMVAFVAAVRARVLDWTPAHCGEAWAVDLVGGRLLDYANQQIWWEDIFSTRYWRRT